MSGPWSTEALIALASVREKAASMKEVVTATTPVNYMFTRPGPWLVMMADKAFYYKPGVTAVAFTTRRIPANTPWRVESTQFLGAQEFPTMAIGTVSNTAVKHARFALLVGHSFVDVAAAEEAFTATTHDIALDGSTPKEAYFLYSADSAGTVTVTKGADAVLGAAAIPAVPAGEAAFGLVKIAHNGATAFDATTDALNAAHLTVTYSDLVAYRAYRISFDAPVSATKVFLWEAD